MENRCNNGLGVHKDMLYVYQKNNNMPRIYVEKYNKIIDFKFEKSCDENFLQVADICAYNVYRQFVEYGRQWSGQEGDGKLNAYDYFRRISCNFSYNSQSKQVRGYGICQLTGTYNNLVNKRTPYHLGFFLGRPRYRRYPHRREVE
jgi:hypothetical protein